MANTSRDNLFKARRQVQAGTSSKMGITTKAISTTTVPGEKVSTNLNKSDMKDCGRIPSLALANIHSKMVSKSIWSTATMALSPGWTADHTVDRSVEI